MDKPAARIALGTVQFGLPYGISNAQGQVAPAEVTRILACCRENGLDTLDTAAAYGQSEQVLGDLLTNFPGFKIISKTHPGTNAARVAADLTASCRRLQLPRLYGYLVHDFGSFEKDPGLFREMQNLRDQGLVNKIGFSLYYPQQLEKLLDQDIPVQLLQIPFNVFDQRFVPYFPLLAKKGVEIHVRSVFLQGLFFRDPQTLPGFFAPLLQPLQKLQQLRRESQVPLNFLLLAFAHSYPELTRLVLGVTSLEELENNLAYVNSLPEMAGHLENLKNLAVENENLLLPFNWPTA